MKGYWIAHVKVTDQASYDKYIAGTKAAFEKYHAKPLARGGRYVQCEGEDRPRNVVLEFASYEDAVNCYNSPEYQAAREHRIDAGIATIVIVEGIE